MAEIALIAGTAMSAIGSIQQGNAANKEAQHQAAQLEQQARAERAASQRKAIEEKRKINLAQSRAQAIAGVGGAALTSPTISSILGGLDFEADYASQYSLAQGEEVAAGLNTQAANARIGGKAAKKAGVMSAIGTVLEGASGMSGGGGSSLFSKYSPQKVTTQGPLPWQSSGNTRPSWMGGGRY